MSDLKYQVLNNSILGFALPPLAMTEEGAPFGTLPKAEYPSVEVHGDGSVTFTVHAPGAKTVEVSGRPGTLWGTQRHPLAEMAEKGWFQGTVTGIPAGFQYMDYWIDGQAVLNPSAPIGWGYGSAVNYVDVPEIDQDFCLWQDVPHGAVRFETYKSESTGTLRSAWVYTPPRYDTEPEKTYPTLYIQHGAGENESGWFWQGKLNWILDNLIASGACREMVVVCNCGYAQTLGAEKTFMNDLSDLILKDCVPFIEKRFRVYADKAHRAMAGLSMGSFQTQLLCFRHPEAFDYIGVFSGATGVALNGKTVFAPLAALNPLSYMKDSGAFNAQHKLLFYARGLDEGGDRLPEEIDALHKMGVKCEYFVCPGVHEWQVWRKTVHSFLPRLF